MLEDHSFIDVPSSALAPFLRREVYLLNRLHDAREHANYHSTDSAAITARLSRDELAISGPLISSIPSFFPELAERMVESSKRRQGDAGADAGSLAHRTSNISIGVGLTGPSGTGQDDIHTASTPSSRQGGATGSSAGAVSSSRSRVRFVEANSYSNVKDQMKQKRKDAQTYKRISAFLQSSVGIDLASSNPDHLPVIVSDLTWVELRSLGTALGMASGAAAQDLLAKEKASIKRAVRLVISELRQRGGGTMADGTSSSGSGSSSSSSSSASSSSAGSAQPSSGLLADSAHLLYALLYSTVDDRYEMISYTMHTLAGIHL